MGTKRDVFKSRTQSAALKSLKNAVEDFLGSGVQSSFLLNGPWGVGKTAAIRSLMDHTELEGQLKAYSYVSLAGVRNVENERAIFLSGLQRLDKLKIKALQKPFEIAGKLGLAVAKATGRQDAAVASLDFLASLGGFLFADSLIVLDDIERKHPDVSMQATLGLITRLTEQQGCRVLVIWNEGQLTDEDQKVLVKAREKAFDAHFFYSPEVPEAVATVVSEGATRERLVRILTPVKINNLRVIQKIEWMLKRVADHLARIENVSQPVQETILDNVVRLCVFYWCSGHEVTEDRLVGSFSTLMIRGIEGRRSQQGSPSVRKENPLEEMILATSFENTEADKVILRFLQNGRLDDKALEEAVSSQQRQYGNPRGQEWQNRFDKELRASFQPFSKELLDEAENLINDEFDNLGIQTIQTLAFALRKGGRDCNRDAVEARWARNLKIPADGNIGDAANHVYSLEAKQILRDRAAEAGRPDPSRGLLNLILANKLISDPLPGEPFTDPVWLRQQLEEACADDLTDILARFYNVIPRLATPEPDGRKSFAKALDEALDLIAETGELNRLRVERVRRQ